MKVIISFLAKIDKLKEFEGVMDSVKATLPEVEGCNDVQIYRDIEQPGAFTLVESWVSRDRHAEHIDSLVTNGSWEQISRLLQDEPISSYFEVY